jgi:soluble lytic murein transglycosylase
MKIKPIALLLTLALIAGLAVCWQRIYKNNIYKAAYPERYQRLIEGAAKLNQLDPTLVYAVIKTESGFKPAAESRIGAKGLMQLTPDTFEWAQMLSPSGDKYTKDDLDNPEVNIKYGTVVLSSLTKEFGSVGTALAAYHAGRSNVIKWLADGNYSTDGKTLYYIPFNETRNYVKRVLATQKLYQSLY